MEMHSMSFQMTRRLSLAAALLCACALPLTGIAQVRAEPNSVDSAGELDRLVEKAVKENAGVSQDAGSFGEASRLLSALDALLEETGEQRRNTRKLPSKKDYFVAVPPWTETREDRTDKIRVLLNSALEIVVDVPLVQMQRGMAKRRDMIAELKSRITRLREKRLDAPTDSLLPGIITDTVDSIGSDIEDLKKRIAANEEEIRKTKAEIGQALAAKGIEMTDDQLDLLLDSVLGSDLVKLVAVFDAAKQIDARLGVLMGENSENIAAARRYFAMHAALFAMLQHAQDTLLEKIDHVYLSRLKDIKKDIRSARRTTKDLLRQDNRPDQQRALTANSKSQEFAERVADFYRDYLRNQRQQILAARKRTHKDLRIADNTYETVEASFQLRALIDDAKASFEAIKGLEAPGFDQVFKNKQLRQEFENLTRKLDVPTS